MQPVEFRILGPLEVYAGADKLLVGGNRGRSILAALLLEANRVVSIQQLIAAAWGDEFPAGVRTQVQNRVSDLRKLFRSRAGGVDPIGTRGSGYMVNVGEGQLDLHEFEHDLRRAAVLEEQGRRVEAIRALDAAMAWWRGPTLDGMSTPVLEVAAIRIEERRLGALEWRARLRLELGQHAEVVSELVGLAAAHPYREGIQSLLMLALYRAGRRAEALEAFRRASGLFREQLGVDAGAELQRLHEGMLRGDTSLDQMPQTAYLTAARHGPCEENGSQQAAPVDVGGNMSEATHHELARLRRENVALTVERDLLKGYLDLWVRETTRSSDSRVTDP
ncbi:AfsR/SARP family transcriptional regulator [Kribbella sp. NBC_01484]|uniref:AfsR/SARP family transcriptional regulator n=1 Tax=Kribbella sp. NBC_01484 TaxID=2903579 RepID=UPI002E2EFA84|nr:AfsR/SARP family transcriptional regulator [Kribbella sp. NBC_01484]